MGLPGEKGVFRELRLYSDNLEGALLGNSYRATYAHEKYNAEALEYRFHRFKPDAVYVWNMQGLSKSLLFRLQSRGVRVLYDLHADWVLEENFSRDPWYRWWFDNPSKRSKAFRCFIHGIGRARRVTGLLPIGKARSLRLEGSYVVSEWLRKRLIEGGFSQVGELPLIYPAIDLKKLTPKKSFRKRRHFVWAGRLHESKAADIAVDAIGILKERGIEVRLDLYGKGEPSERKAKRERIEAAGLIGQVTMRGIRPGELTGHYARYDALLYTSRRGEPFSMTVLEAMLSKLPCIVADSGGNVELLEDGKDALLYKGGEAVALADAIETFMLREDAGRGLAEHSIERLQVEQTMDTFCQQIESLLSLKK